MAVISIRIPRDITTKQAKALLLSGAKKADYLIFGSYPIELQGRTVSAKIAVNATEQALFSDGRKDNETIGELISRIIAIEYLLKSKAPVAKRAITTHEILSAVADADPMFKRSDLQQSAARLIAEAMEDSGKYISMIEAPTGTGKTTAMLVAAIDAIRAGVPRVVIAVPTISLMEQIHREWLTKLVPAINDLPAISYIVGKNRFVSEVKVLREIQRMVDSLADRPNQATHELVMAARQWLVDNDTHHRTGSHPADLAFSMDSMVEDEAMIGFPPCRLDASTPASDGGLMAYQAQFARAESAQIVVCTHAMIAIDARIRQSAAKSSYFNGRTIDEIRVEYANSGEADAKAFSLWLSEEINRHDTQFKLPAYDHLILDEGHAFENSMASVMADELSLHSLLSMPSMTQKASAEISGLIAKLVAMEEYGDISLYDSPAAVDVIFQIHAAIKTIRKPSDELLAAAKVLRLSLDRLNKNGFSIKIHYSPIKKYPRLSTGMSTVHFMLTYLWQNVSHVAMISGSLFLPTSDGFSTAYLQTCHSIPKDRVITHRLPAPGWHTTPVLVVAPSVVDIMTCHANNVWLSPPKTHLEDYTRQLARWAHDLADVIAYAHSTAAGGMLVLMTSYDAVDAVNQALINRGMDNLIIADREVGAKIQRDRFVNSYHAGNKPIWVAVGGSWTGLDLSDNCEPGQDNLLTDLIIPRYPVGANRSITHAYRKARLGWHIELNDTMLFLRQGLGRLVRREGIPNNRRIWLLDTRMYVDKQNPLKGMISRLLDAYQRFGRFQKIEVDKLKKQD